MCRDGRLKVGDRILEINGADATKVPLSEAYDMLMSVNTSVSMLVEYNVSVIGQNQIVLHFHEILTALSVHVIIHHHIRFWYLWCCGCPGLRGRQHLATPHTRSP